MNYERYLMDLIFENHALFIQKIANNIIAVVLYHRHQARRFVIAFGATEHNRIAHPRQTNCKNIAKPLIVPADKLARANAE